MKWIYRIFRALILTALIMCVAIPALLYVVISLPAVQNQLREVAETELSRLLDSKVTIGSVSLTPFNQVAIYDAVITDKAGNDTILKANTISAGIDLDRFFMDDKIEVTHAILRGVNVRLWREAPGAPLNIQHIIAALQPKDKSKPPTKFDFKVQAVVLRQCGFTYDVKSKPRSTAGFDPNHIAVERLRADISLPRMMNDDFTVDIRRLAADERSGLVVKNFEALVHASNKELSVRGLNLQMPSTQLRLADITLPINGWSDVMDALGRRGASLTLIEGSYVNPSDFSCFLPVLSKFNEKFPVNFEVSGNKERIRVDHFNIGSFTAPLYASLKATVTAPFDKRRLSCDIDALDVSVDGRDVMDIARQVSHVSETLASDIAAMGQLRLEASGKVSMTHASGKATLDMAHGKVEVDGEWQQTSPGVNIVNASAVIPGIALDAIIHNDNFGEVAGNINVNARLVKGGANEISGEANLSKLTLRGYTYSNVMANASMVGDLVEGDVRIDDPNGRVALKGEVDINRSNPRARLTGEIGNVNFSRLNLWHQYPDYELSATINADVAGLSIESIEGEVTIDDFSFVNPHGKGLSLDRVRLTADNSSQPRTIQLQSDLLDGSITGDYHFGSLPRQFKELVSHAMPVLFTDVEHVHPDGDRARAGAYDNDFEFSFRLRETAPLHRFVKLPVDIIDNVTVDGRIDYADGFLELQLDAPSLKQGNKVIENTVLNAMIDGNVDSSQLYFTSEFPTKEGKMPITVKSSGASDRIDTDINWMIQRARDYHGNVSLSTLVGRDDDGKMMADVSINPSELVFNDTVWTVHPSTIQWRRGRIAVDNFNVGRSGQFVKIDGCASSDVDDVLRVDLQKVNLDYIFEALGLANVTLGGDATGTLTGAALLSSAPELRSESLRVEGISFNKCVFGNADVVALWDVDRQAVNLNAVIHQPDNRKSYIAGDIFATRDSLSLRFDCDRVNIAFLKPYTQAFCSDISGRASGWAQLYGTFKDINLKGDVYGEDVKMKIDIINTSYTVTDSVHIKPGRIELAGITLHDQYGHTALLNGEITHDFFRNPCFDFKITDARDFLVYDMTEKLNPDWFGHVLADGSASIVGVPGHIDIRANMATAPGSSFTFVLNDRLDASEYNFIQFRDATPHPEEASIERVPAPVITLPAASSTYNISFDIELDPDIKMTLVMDPAGGDRVQAWGAGHLQMSYDSASEDLVMRGVYTLDKGTYNFTLQDIIIRDFAINAGSSVAFKGDPYSAQLDLQAVYSTTANLSDLDESFLHDRDLNRTNVPVQALLNVKGDMRAPDVSFDLAFPTLNADVDRKVKSIVSTEDMINRQIVYLLALNRFYTPEYVASATRGNELFAVASSTISSQLSNILGHLADNWTIAPNVRSERGDFSDVEVDLALSSRLLNNRLLFNGNLGYRDKSLNTTQFIGDFDLEYLLNRKGTLRLKAYNRYNDQNYYIRTATTTQGVGLVFRKDFDDLFPSLRRRRQSEPSADSTQPDSVAAPVISLTHPAQ